MDSHDPPATDPQAGSLWGKRGYPRHAVSLRVELGGMFDRLGGRAVEVSGGGTLVKLTPAAVDALRRRQSQNLAAALQGVFPEGLDVHFLEARVTVPADLMRLTLPEGRAADYLVGCRFRRPLSLAQLAQIGVESTSVEHEPLGVGIELPWTEASPFDDLPWVPRQQDAVSMRVFDEAHTAGSPRYHAQVRSMGPRAITAVLGGADISEVTAALGGGPFAFRVVSGPDSWTARGTLVAARFVDVPGGAVEVALVTTEPPTRRLRRAFQRRRAG